MAMRCDAMRFDFVLIKSERLATSFSSVLFAAAPVEPVDLPISTCRCRCCHTVGKEINAYIYSITSVEAIRLNIYLFTFSIPILPLSLTSSLSTHFLIPQIDLYLLLEPNEDKCLRISRWAVLGSRLIDM